MKRDYKLYLSDIKECIIKIEEYTKGKSKEQFLDDEMLQDAVIRKLEIIGEAIKNIPGSLKEKNPHVNWHVLSNFRDFMVHTYYESHLNRIWIAIKQDIPKLKEGLKNIQMV